MNQVLQEIVVLFLIMGIGAVLGRAKVLDHQGEAKISKLILKFTLPALIFTSMDREFEQTLLHNLEIVVFWTLLWSVVMIAAVEGYIKKSKQKQRAATAAFTIVFGNTSFMGMPIAQAMFGSKGVFYVACMSMVFNTLMYSYGISLFQKDKKPDVKQLFLNSGFLATVAGFLVFLTPVTLPYVLKRPLSWCGDMTIPLALLVAGSTVGRARISELFHSVGVWLTVSVRLLVFPVIMYPVLTLCQVNASLTALLTVVFATPAPLMSGAFSEEYGGDTDFANKVLVLSNLLSVATMTALVYFLQCN